MIAYARNRRHNGLQLRNGIEFLSCGVTERVNNYLMYHGLTCGRKTATDALKTLAVQAEHDLKDSFKLYNSLPMAPSFCIHNLDIEERVHTHSTGHRSHTFHGTWGYVHYPSKQLLDTLDLSELTLDRFHEAMRAIPSTRIEPRMLLPNKESKDHYRLVWKSQIARVMHHYIAIPDKSAQPYALDPPPIEEIDPSVPDIRMLPKTVLKAWAKCLNP
jgi:hypothetical protein